MSGTSLVYTPPGTFTGTATFTYVARDPSGALSNPASVAVTVGGTANVAPVASSFSITVTRGVPSNGQVSATDANNDVLTYQVVAMPRKGTLTLSSSGAFTYTASASAKGGDSFTFKANDGKADSNTAKVTIAFQ